MKRVDYKIPFDGEALLFGCYDLAKAPGVSCISKIKLSFLGKNPELEKANLLRFVDIDKIENPTTDDKYFYEHYYEILFGKDEKWSLINFNPEEAGKLKLEFMHTETEDINYIIINIGHARTDDEISLRFDIPSELTPGEFTVYKVFMSCSGLRDCPSCCQMIIEEYAQNSHSTYSIVDGIEYVSVTEYISL